MSSKLLYLTYFMGLIVILQAQSTSNSGTSGNELNFNNLAQAFNVNNITAVPGMSQMGNFTNMVPGGGSHIPGMSGFPGVSGGNQQQHMTQMMTDPCTWRTMANMATAMSAMQQQSHSAASGSGSSSSSSSSSASS